MQEECLLDRILLLQVGQDQKALEANKVRTLTQALRLANSRLMIDTKSTRRASPSPHQGSLKTMKDRQMLRTRSRSNLLDKVLQTSLRRKGSRTKALLPFLTRMSARPAKELHMKVRRSHQQSWPKQGIKLLRVYRSKQSGRSSSYSPLCSSN